ncbi:hypothetical protein WOLCODRAFT_136741 [Wolfiporia cocos MD-104 SS10]|uniref:BTB domain-containing protein n=1 Tax=Wolfiporia cocos (strain MD-104) TaxID=742152 RepID=A0A2H3JR57_WOLCO|nr:hypothetical protein WOLCODRAFT_136741 [Wolfiporia cocos MD-104 SS10]
MALDEGVRRDGACYFADRAMCVIRVEDTLFKVPKYLLAHDSSAFEHMFALPAPGNGDSEAGSSQEGLSDDNPIHLCGESAEQFRLLLSILRAPPYEVAAYNTASADIPKLLSIALITNKYHFEKTTEWAIDAVYSVVTGEYGDPAPCGDLSKLSSATLARIAAVALACGHTRLVYYVVQRWADRIQARELSPRPAMAFADEHGLSTLRGVAYYVQLMDCGLEIGQTTTPSYLDPASPPSATPSGSTCGAEDTEDDAHMPLTPKQHLRLLSGYRRLTMLWHRLQHAPPKFAQPGPCTYHVQGCVSTFEAVWSEAAMSARCAALELADVLGRLRCAEEMLNTSIDIAVALSPACKREAMLAVRRLVQEVQDSLHEHFVDLTDPHEGGL